MTRDSSANFTPTGFHSRDIKIRFSSPEAVSHTSYDNAAGDNTSEFFSAAPLEEDELPIFPMNFLPSDWKIPTLRLVLITLLVLPGLIYAIHRHPRHTSPLATCGYPPSRFSFLADAPAEILGFSRDFLKLHQQRINAATNTTEAFEALRASISNRQAELVFFWNATSAMRIGLTGQQVQWIVERVQAAEKALLGDVERAQVGMRAWRFSSPKTRAPKPWADEDGEALEEDIPPGIPSKTKPPGM